MADTRDRELVHQLKEHVKEMNGIMSELAKRGRIVKVYVLGQETIGSPERPMVLVNVFEVIT